MNIDNLFNRTHSLLNNYHYLYFYISICNINSMYDRTVGVIMFSGSRLRSASSQLV